MFEAIDVLKAISVPASPVSKQFPEFLNCWQNLILDAQILAVPPVTVFGLNAQFCSFPKVKVLALAENIAVLAFSPVFAFTIATPLEQR